MNRATPWAIAASPFSAVALSASPTAPAGLRSLGRPGEAERRFGAQEREVPLDPLGRARKVAHLVRAHEVGAEGEHERRLGAGQSSRRAKP